MTQHTDVTGPSGYGPKVTVKRRCSDCKACNSESYAVQGDSGHYVYCEHPSLPERKYIGDTHWDTPDWCPAAAPTAHPASQQEAGKAVHQFRKQHCADWYDGRADHGDSGGPYEERTLYTVPQPAAQGDALDAARLDWLENDVGCRVFHLGKSWYTRANFGMPYHKRASLREAIDAARAAQEGKKP